MEGYKDGRNRKEDKIGTGQEALHIMALQCFISYKLLTQSLYCNLLGIAVAATTIGVVPKES